MSVPTFNALCPVEPVALGNLRGTERSRKRLERFDRLDLDRWIDGLKADEAKSDFDRALEQLDAQEARAVSRH